MKVIHCAVVGKGFTIFSVQMKVYETVEDLRKKIKAEMQFSVAAPKLQLFFAKKNGRWLKITDRDFSFVVNGKTPRWIDTKVVLHPFCWIDYHSLAFPNSEDLTATDINDVHILVKDLSLKEDCVYFVLLLAALIVLFVVAPNFTTQVGDILHEGMAAQEVLAHAVATARGDMLSTHQCDLLAPENEYLDPNPDLHSLFLEYNRMFFEERLAGCEVKWSKRMTLCAGLCSFQPRSGFCSIRLSEPLLKLRPRSDMVNTLLHEMIHAYVFVATPVRDHDDHGPLFQSHMHRINKAAKTQITVFHSFHDEVDAYRQHIWQCDGPCRRKAPYFGLVKRSMNRVPGPNDTWWADHERSCGGSYSKIKEPAAFTAKQAKKKQRELARAEKQKKKDEEAKVAPSVKQFFPTVEEKVGGKANKALRDDTKPPRASKKTLSQAKPEVDNNKKRKKESGGDNNSSSWPMLGFPAVAPVIFSADGDEDGYFLVGDLQALFQTAPTQPFHGSIGTRDQTAIPGSTTQTKSEAVPVVDLTVSDGDTSDTEGGQVEFKHSPSAAAISQTTLTQTAEPDVIEID